MRCFLCALLLGCSLLAQEDVTSPQVHPAGNGTFYVKGIVYQYLSGTDYTVVAAAHSALNRKFVAVKVRVYNASQRSITVKPEDVVLEDAVKGHAVAAVTGEELAKRMRRPYNWARYAVTPMGGQADTNDDNMSLPPQMMEMMKAMAARMQGTGTAATPGGQGVLYTDTPGALRPGESARGSGSVCDQVCQLRNVEANGVDVLSQLQRQTEPDNVQDSAFLANTIPPRANAAGVLFCPMGKLTEAPQSANRGRKGRQVQVMVKVGGESFPFVLAVE